MANEWQDIATAPKDGSEVMLFRASWGIGVVAKWMYSDDCEECDGWHLRDNVYVPGALSEGFVGWEEEADIMPTHWIAPPTSAESDDETTDPDSTDLYVEKGGEG